MDGHINVIPFVSFRRSATCRELRLGGRGREIGYDVYRHVQGCRSMGRCCCGPLAGPDADNEPPFNA